MLSLMIDRTLTFGKQANLVSALLRRYYHSHNLHDSIVPEVGLEPTRPFGHRFLRAARLPVPAIRA